MAVGCQEKHFINSIHFFTFIHLFIQQHAANYMPEIVLGAGVGHTAVKKIDKVVAFRNLSFLR